MHFLDLSTTSTRHVLIQKNRAIVMGKTNRSRVQLYYCLLVLISPTTIHQIFVVVLDTLLGARIIRFMNAEYSRIADCYCHD